MKPLFDGAEWDMETIETTWAAIDKIGKEVFGLSYYEPQIEIITSEQMLDSYSSVAMPVMYNHWSFGKSFIQNQRDYEKGRMGLAYEVVINTEPTIAYLMEDNTMTMQALVLAHAVCGHGSFFKNNYMFKEWTDAAGIIGYLKFAKEYIESCEQRYGANAVEELLDACHTIQYYGVDKYKRPPLLSKELEHQRKKEEENYIQSSFNELWKNTVPTKVKKKEHKYVDWEEEFTNGQYERGFPEENLLYFIEKKSPALPDWQREIVRIVRKISQYFYPQMQTQLMNEGWASFTHYQIMTEMYNQGLLTEGSYIEFLASHTAVTMQPDFDSKYYSGINVYALGFAMMMDLKRICENPDEEDIELFPAIANTNWKVTLPEIIEMYRDETFVLQFLSPKVADKFKLFILYDHESDDQAYHVQGTHKYEDLLHLREALSKQYSLTYRMPQIEIVGVDWSDTRRIALRYTPIDGKKLETDSSSKVLLWIEFLWGFEAQLVEDGYTLDDDF